MHLAPREDLSNQENLLLKWIITDQLINLSASPLLFKAKIALPLNIAGSMTILYLLAKVMVKFIFTQQSTQPVNHLLMDLTILQPNILLVCMLWKSLWSLSMLMKILLISIVKEESLFMQWITIPLSLKFLMNFKLSIQMILLLPQIGLEDLLTLAMLTLPLLTWVKHID